MRMAVCGAVVAASLYLTAAARADIYLYRDADGVLHFTNAPSDGKSRLTIKEHPLPPPPRMLVPSHGLLYSSIFRAHIPTAMPTSYDSLIREIAERNNVEYALVKAVIKAESDFDRLAVSPKGALGLMQLMPKTAAAHQVRNVVLPRDNIEGGCRQLRLLLDRYEVNLTLAIAAYTACTQLVEESGGAPPMPEQGG